jgi:hypothetical protein
MSIPEHGVASGDYLVRRIAVLIADVGETPPSVINSVADCPAATPNRV